MPGSVSLDARESLQTRPFGVDANVERHGTFAMLRSFLRSRFLLPANQIAVVTYLLYDFASMHRTFNLYISRYRLIWVNTLQIGRHHVGGHQDQLCKKLPVFRLSAAPNYRAPLYLMLVLPLLRHSSIIPDGSVRTCVVDDRTVSPNHWLASISCRRRAFRTPGRRRW